jgi:hypothetical protein
MGEEFCRAYLDPPRCGFDTLRDNWFSSLVFCLEHTFMQHRAAENSWQLCETTVSALRNSLCVADEADQAYRLLRRATITGNLESLIPPTSPANTPSELSDAVLNNARDRKMVLSLLRYVAEEDETPRNLVVDIVEEIRNAPNISTGLERAHTFLDGFHGVGFKIASLTLRDLALLLRKEPLIPLGLQPDAYTWAFPVDVLVAKVAPMLGCRQRAANESDDTYFAVVRNYFIVLALQSGIGPPLIAAGLWFVNFHSLRLCVDYLVKGMRWSND